MSGLPDRRAEPREALKGREGPLCKPVVFTGTFTLPYCVKRHEHGTPLAPRTRDHPRKGPTAAPRALMKSPIP